MDVSGLYAACFMEHRSYSIESISLIVLLKPRGMLNFGKKKEVLAQSALEFFTHNFVVFG